MKGKKEEEKQWQTKKNERDKGKEKRRKDVWIKKEQRNKGKFDSVFNWAPRHEGVLGKWKYSSTHSLTSALGGSEWSASRPAALVPGKENLVTIGYEAGWATEPFRMR
jgi:hypothetical protein